MTLTRRGRRALAGLSLALAVILGVVVWSSLFERSPIARPSDPCATPPPLRTRQGVTLQPAAMKAYRKAERIAGRRIPVIQSYRSCAAQALACRNICGSSNGCPGRCAKPGTSYHQLGAAIDVPTEVLHDPELVGALRKAGWCQSVPVNDPGHFSFGGCH